MFRSVLQTLLCLVLCPPLVAQTNAQATPRASQAGAKELPKSSPADNSPSPSYVTAAIPAYTPIYLAALDDVSSATAKVGSTVRFVVSRNVDVQGITVIRIGTPVTGTIVGVKRGVNGHRAGRLRIRIDGISLGKGLSLHLTSRYQSVSRSCGDKVIESLLALTSPGFFIMTEVAFRSERSPAPKRDAELPRCHITTEYTKSQTNLRLADIMQLPEDEVRTFRDLCRTNKPANLIDQAVSGRPYVKIN